MIKIIKLRVVIALMVSLFTGVAYGHAITMGYENAGSIGAVDLWMGSYHTGSSSNFEGSLTLTGINGNSYAANTVNFSLWDPNKPAGLVDGVNNFYAATQHNAGSALDDGTYWSANLETNYGDATNWQGVSFTGLTSGDYDFSYACSGCSMYWDPWNSGLTSSFTLTDDVIAGSPIPEPTVIALFTAGLFGLGLVRRRKVQP
jgi:hypothetical protein